MSTVTSVHARLAHAKPPTRVVSTSNQGFVVSLGTHREHDVWNGQLNGEPAMCIHMDVGPARVAHGHVEASAFLMFKRIHMCIDLR